jgi:hypothetical protein
MVVMLTDDPPTARLKRLNEAKEELYKREVRDRRELELAPVRKGSLGEEG